MCENGSNEHDFITSLETVKFDWTLPLLETMRGQTNDKYPCPALQ